MQTKEALTLRASAFGSKCELPAPLMDKVLKAGLSDSIIRFAEFKSQKDLKKSDGSKRSRLVGEPRWAAGPTPSARSPASPAHPSILACRAFSSHPRSHTSLQPSPPEQSSCRTLHGTFASRLQAW